jgi:hypothetical protein
VFVQEFGAELQDFYVFTEAIIIRKSPHHIKAPGCETELWAIEHMLHKPVLGLHPQGGAGSSKVT